MELRTSISGEQARKKCSATGPLADAAWGKVLGLDNGLGEPQSLCWQHSGWENITKSCLKKYSMCLNPTDLVPGSPRHVSAASTSDAFHAGSDAASPYSARSNGKNSCSCHTSLSCKAGLHQLDPCIWKPPFQFLACETIPNNNIGIKVEFTVCKL